MGRRGSGWAERGPLWGHALRAASALPGIDLGQKIVCGRGGIGARTMEHPVQLTGGVDRHTARTAMNPASSSQWGPCKCQCSQLAKPILQGLSPCRGAYVGQRGGGTEGSQGGLPVAARRLAGGGRWLLPLAPCRGGQRRGNLPSAGGWWGHGWLRWECHGFKTHRIDALQRSRRLGDRGGWIGQGTRVSRQRRWRQWLCGQRSRPSGRRYHIRGCCQGGHAPGCGVRRRFHVECRENRLLNRVPDMFPGRRSGLRRNLVGKHRQEWHDHHAGNQQ